MIEDRVTNLLNEAELALSSIVLPTTAQTPRQVKSFRLEEFGGQAENRSFTGDSNAARDTELKLRIELGRTQLHPDEVNLLRTGSVIRLEQATGEPVDIYAGEQLVARGEVLVLDEKIGVRIVELVGA